LHFLTNRCIREPYVQWCERLSPSAKAGGAVYSITNWPLFIFNRLAINFAVPCALGQAHSLTSFGFSVGSWGLAMCVAVKRWHCNHLLFGGVLLCGSTGTVFGPGFGASGFFLGVGDGVDLL
ncbi:MAG: hypothetical protein M0Q12_06375, partial [Synergistaceae bacterium]|nr:hypothetical protein [Synergistaceae bacterium]